MFESESTTMNMEMEESSYIKKQLNLNRIMEMDTDKREIVMSLLKSEGSFRTEIRNMINDLGLIIDVREAVIDEIIKK